MQTPKEVLANTHLLVTSYAPSLGYYTHIVSLANSKLITLKDFFCEDSRVVDMLIDAKVVVQTLEQANAIKGLFLLSGRSNLVEYREVFWDILNVLRNTDVAVPYTIFKEAISSFDEYLKAHSPDWPYEPCPAVEFWVKESMNTPRNFINVVTKGYHRMPHKLASIIREKTFLLEGL